MITPADPPNRDDTSHSSVSISLKIEYKFLSWLIPRRFRKEALGEIEEKYSELLESKGIIEAKQYLRWEIRKATADCLLHHLKIMLIIEGVLRLLKFFGPT